MPLGFLKMSLDQNTSAFCQVRVLVCKSILEMIISSLQGFVNQAKIIVSPGFMEPLSKKSSEIVFAFGKTS